MDLDPIPELALEHLWEPCTLQDPGATSWNLAVSGLCLSAVLVTLGPSSCRKTGLSSGVLPLGSEEQKPPGAHTLLLFDPHLPDPWPSSTSSFLLTSPSSLPSSVHALTASFPSSAPNPVLPCCHQGLDPAHLPTRTGRTQARRFSGLQSGGGGRHPRTQSPSPTQTPAGWPGPGDTAG